uniref:ATP-grasp domain-containing protein n=1 Tax=Algoriphagus sp. TaxID=1872435 RepID=UPI0040473D11
MKKILVLGASDIQVPLILKCKENGLFTIVIDKDINAIGGKFADLFLEISTNDLPSICNLVQEQNLDAIITTSDFPVQIVSKVASQFNLISCSIYVAELCTNKFWQRSFLEDSGFHIPRYELIEKFESLLHFSKNPFVLKPIDSSGSRGVKLVTKNDDLVQCYLSSKLFSKSGVLIAEEFIGGREFSVETLSQNGITKIIAITEKHLIGQNNGYFVEDCHIIPANLDQDEINLINDVVIGAANKIGFDNCGGHIEIKLFNKEVYIIEMACRLGGDFISSELVPLATGVDMLQNLINISLGVQIDTKHKTANFAAVQFINKYNYIYCKSEIESNNKLIVKSEIKPYMNIEPSNSFERLGYIVLKSDSENELRDFIALASENY